MAIAFARARYIGRASGGSAVRSAAYNAREGIRDERTGELYYFAHRDAPEHHEVLLPAGASAELQARLKALQDQKKAAWPSGKSLDEIAASVDTVTNGARTLIADADSLKAKLALDKEIAALRKRVDAL